MSDRFSFFNIFLMIELEWIDLIHEEVHLTKMNIDLAQQCKQIDLIDQECRIESAMDDIHG